MPQPKYICVSIGNIITQIAKQTETKNYTEGVLGSYLPDIDEVLPDKELKKEAKRWTKENNRRMIAICKFLNDNNL